MITEEERILLDLISKDDLVSLTQALVKIDSVLRPESGNTEKEAADFIAGWVNDELGVTPVVEEVEPGRENIIVTLDSRREGPCLLLEGHSDVVSEGNRDTWSHDPFGGEIAGGRIFGRGSCDMKGGVAVNLIVARAFVQAGLPFDGRLKLAVVCDEEGMMIGIKDFIQKGHADDVDAALVSEPEENQLCLSMKGAIRAVVRVTGKMAHGAMPRTGINPNTRLARIILEYGKFESEEIERYGEDPFLGFPSITFTVLQSPPAGEPAQLNVMPGSAAGYLDIRTTPAQNHETIRARLKELLRQMADSDPDFKAEIEFIEDRPVVTMGKNEQIVVEAARAYTDITGKQPVYNGVPGATDGTFLRAWKGIPSLVNGPGPRHMPHQADEYIDIEELYDAARMYALTAMRFLSQS